MHNLFHADIDKQRSRKSSSRMPMVRCPQHWTYWTVKTWDGSFGVMKHKCFRLYWMNYIEIEWLPTIRHIINKLENKLTCWAETLEIQVGSKQGVLFSASYEVSFAFPQSRTKTTSFIVILVSAIFVASTIFLTPSSGSSKIKLCMLNKKSVSVLFINKKAKHMFLQCQKPDYVFDKIFSKSIQMVCGYVKSILILSSSIQFGVRACPSQHNWLLRDSNSKLRGI